MKENELVHNYVSEILKLIKNINDESIKFFEFTQNKHDYQNIFLKAMDMLLELGFEIHITFLKTAYNVRLQWV